MTDRKEISAIVFVACVMMTLLSCCDPVSSFLSRPHVTRTTDAIIIDFSDVGYSSFLHDKWQSQIADSRFIPMPSINPLGMHQNHQLMFYKGWPFIYGNPNVNHYAPENVPSNKQIGDYEELVEDFDRPLGKQAIQVAPAPTTTPTTTTTPAPTPSCGKGPTTFPILRSLVSERIAAGTDAKKSSWPFMVALRKLSGNANTVICGGVLLTENKVLLAAQCLEQLTMSQMQDLTVLIGVNEVTSTRSDAQMTRRINKVILHNGYDASTYANDIAIIILDAPVTLSKTVMPVCLPPASTDPDQYLDQNAIVMGWAGSAKLQQGQVSIVSVEDCRSMKFIGQYISNTNICVNSENVFTCPNDIGGPVVVMSSPGTWTLIGINSYSEQDCATNGLKTRVSAFIPWIEQYKKMN